MSFVHAISLPSCTRKSRGGSTGITPSIKGVYRVTVCVAITVKIEIYRVVTAVTIDGPCVSRDFPVGTGTTLNVVSDGLTAVGTGTTSSVDFSPLGGLTQVIVGNGPYSTLSPGTGTGTTDAPTLACGSLATRSWKVVAVEDEAVARMGDAQTEAAKEIIKRMNLDNGIFAFG